MARKSGLVRYVAFLRGINVGGHRVKMERLRELFAELGFEGAETFIASGNVIFRAPGGEPAGIEAKVEAHLGRALGYAVDTFLRTADELASVVAARPFAEEEAGAPGHSLYVAFLRGPLAGEAERALLAFRTEVDELHVRGRELHWLCRGKMTDSKIEWRKLERAIAMSTTVRNMTMLRKLAALYPPG
jgi:uncharacterized protein (DUF1697 family)